MVTIKRQASLLTVGDRIRHPVFGWRNIMSIDDECIPGQRLITVEGHTPMMYEPDILVEVDHVEDVQGPADQGVPGPDRGRSEADQPAQGAGACAGRDAEGDFRAGSDRPAVGEAGSGQHPDGADAGDPGDNQAGQFLTQIKIKVELIVEVEKISLGGVPCKVHPDFLIDMVVPNLYVDHELFDPEEEDCYKIVDRQITGWEDLTDGEKS